MTFISHINAHCGYLLQMKNWTAKETTSLSQLTLTRLHHWPPRRDNIGAWIEGPWWQRWGLCAGSTAWTPTYQNRSNCPCLQMSNLQQHRPTRNLWYGTILWRHQPVGWWQIKNSLGPCILEWPMVHPQGDRYVFQVWTYLSCHKGSASTINWWFMECLICRHGIAHTIHSTRGPTSQWGRCRVEPLTMGPTAHIIHHTALHQPDSVSAATAF